MEDNRRKIIYQDSNYQLLKPRNDGTDRFNLYGKRKSLKAVRDIIERKIYDLEIGEKVKKRLSSKVI